MRRKTLTLVVVLCFFGAFVTEATAAKYRSVVIKGVPHVQQKPDFCGAACAAMYLRKLGKPTDQDAVFDKAELAPTLGRGCYTRDLSVALKNIDFNIGSTWHRIAATDAAAE
jgi:hypothetical protein